MRSKLSILVVLGLVAVVLGLVVAPVNAATGIGQLPQESGGHPIPSGGSITWGTITMNGQTYLADYEDTNGDGTVDIIWIYFNVTEMSYGEPTPFEMGWDNGAYYEGGGPGTGQPRRRITNIHWTQDDPPGDAVQWTGTITNPPGGPTPCSGDNNHNSP